jgi:hypothetical protein
VVSWLVAWLVCLLPYSKNSPKNLSCVCEKTVWLFVRKISVVNIRGNFVLVMKIVMILYSIMIGVDEAVVIFLGTYKFPDGNILKRNISSKKRGGKKKLKDGIEKTPLAEG